MRLFGLLALCWTHIDKCAWVCFQCAHTRFGERLSAWGGTWCGGSMELYSVHILPWSDTHTVLSVLENSQDDVNTTESWVEGGLATEGRKGRGSEFSLALHFCLFRFFLWAFICSPFGGVLGSMFSAMFGWFLRQRLTDAGRLLSRPS